MHTPPAGLLLVDKPAGLTSHDVVDRLRHLFGVKKVGHAGTLDPLATGILLVLVGRAYTKTAASYLGLDKSYQISLELGWTTDTLDSDGSPVTQLPLDHPRLVRLTRSHVQAVLPRLTGTINQPVPAYSAVKRGGEKLYQKARRGESIDRPIRTVTVRSLTLNRFVPSTDSAYPRIALATHVSSGTYTRSLVEALGRLLTLPAVQTGLVRTRLGPYLLSDCHSLSEIIKHPHPADLLNST